MAIETTGGVVSFVVSGQIMDLAANCTVDTSTTERTVQGGLTGLYSSVKRKPWSIKADLVASLNVNPKTLESATGYSVQVDGNNGWRYLGHGAKLVSAVESNLADGTISGLEWQGDEMKVEQIT